jgi:hypothetical protein
MNPFEETLREATTVKDMPNTQFSSEAFLFKDYVMADPEMWAYAPEGEVDVEKIARRKMINLFSLWLSHVPEIEVSTNINSDYGDMITCNVEVSMPEDEERQKNLARLVATTWEERIRR